jgi:hypothetical protein
MKLRSIASRYRLLSSVMALALALVALAYSSPAAFAQHKPGMLCEEGCVNWNAEQGCIQNMLCCSYSDGSYECWDIT